MFVATQTQLNPTEQDALVKQIGLALLRAVPADWEQVSAEYRAVGRHLELNAELVTADGESRPWRAPQDVAALFGRLRAGMYREGRGTWFNARYQLDKPTSYNLEYDREEPEWRTPPPPQAYTDEMRTFPRTEDNVPEWLQRKLTSLPQERPPGPRFRVARIFDGMGPSGRPVVNRPPVDDADRDDLLEYLDRAPVVVPARGYDVDRLDADARPSVPVAFHSDGTWIWPAAVNHYLRKYGVPPEADLVEHIRQNDFEIPELDEQTGAAAAAFVERGAPPARLSQGPPPMRPPGTPQPQQGPPPGQQGPPPLPRPPQGPPPPPQQPVPQPAQAPGSVAVKAPPAAALPSQGGPGPALGELRARFDDYGVPDSVYRIGPPVDGTWTLERTDEGWRVGWFDGEYVAPAVFEDIADASAFLLGKVLLDGNWQPVAPPMPPAPMPMPAVPVDAELNGREEHHDFHEPQPVHLEHDTHDRYEPEPPPVLRDHETHDRYEPEQHDDGQDDLLHDEATVVEEALQLPPPPAATPELDGDGLEHTMVSPLPDFDDEDDNDDPDLHLMAGQGVGGLPPVGRPPHDELGDTQAAPMPALFDDEDDEDHPDVRDEDTVREDEGMRPRFDSDPQRRPQPSPGLFTPAVPAAEEPQEQRTELFTPLGDSSGVEDTVRAHEPAPKPPQADWPIKPLDGEPPLTLFRGKRMVELVSGTEIDRFGEPDGNLSYAVGTSFEARSLVPEWINRPYHRYRVLKSFEALTGSAIPWFDQPGGGTAFLLPDPVGQLVMQGYLLELDGAEGPSH